MTNEKFGLFPGLDWQPVGPYKETWQTYFDDYGVVGSFVEGWTVVESEYGGSVSIKDEGIEHDRAVYLARGYEKMEEHPHDNTNRRKAIRLGRKALESS